MSYSHPKTLAEAALLTKRETDCMFIAGGTDLMVRRSLGLDATTHLIDLTGIRELRGITLEGDTLSIGAATTLAELASNATVQSHFLALTEAALAIASPSIRNSGTVAGNLLCENRCIYYDQSEFWQTAAGGCLKCGAEVCIATGSAKHCYSVFISDLAPVLIVIGAQVEILEEENAHNIVGKPVEWLYTGDGLASHTTSKRDILTRILIPIPKSIPRVLFRKIRPRGSVDFTNLTVALRQSHDGTTTVAVSGIGPAPAVVRDTTTNDAGSLATALLKQSQIIDNLSYRRSYRKEMLTEVLQSMTKD
ncbi:MAG: FAD binding domain-containing protein [Bacteroidota bacterium]|nr:FAD binding domain-containing protein [Bacteroidota bacterium]MDP4233232.1 FAD binding domain-containing protein [Bacteroidota bacterium]MDP4242149.1 FAD binding domain-containing protein [Bacteroidota bacterium]MDP4287798.1 FAD binding domain-containing protein [Bacteroidota bacterium]